MGDETTESCWISVAGASESGMAALSDFHPHSGRQPHRLQVPCLLHNACLGLGFQKQSPSQGLGAMISQGREAGRGLRESAFLA